VLFNRLRDYCMWCSAELPETLRLPEADKQILRAQQEKEAQERRRKTGDDKDSYHWADGNVLGWGAVPGGSSDSGGNDC